MFKNLTSHEKDATLVSVISETPKRSNFLPWVMGVSVAVLTVVVVISTFMVLKFRKKGRMNYFNREVSVAGKCYILDLHGTQI